MSQHGSGSKRPFSDVIDFTVDPTVLKHRINKWRELFPDNGNDYYFSSAPPSPWALGGEERPGPDFDMVDDGADSCGTDRGAGDEDWICDVPRLQQIPARSRPPVLPERGRGGPAPAAPEEKKAARGDADPSLDDVADLESDDRPNGGFRYSGRHFGLTYAQVGDVDPEDLLEYLRGLPEVQEVMVSTEKHKDGGTHFHVFGSFNKKRNIRDARFWDWQELHPNIKFLKGKAGVTAWRSYITKEGNFITTEQVSAANSKNWIQRVKDHDAWKAYGKRNMQKLFGVDRPVHLFGQDWPATTERRRNFWIFGAAEVGKTKSVRRFTMNWTFFNRRTGPGYYEGYNGEEFIIVDDQDKDLPSKDEINQMTNGAEEKGEWPVYSKTRYINYFLKVGVLPRYFIISQEPPVHLHERWFSSRFIVIEVRGRVGVGDDAQWDVREIVPSDY